jgi:hypothetical protein
MARDVKSWMESAIAPTTAEIRITANPSGGVRLGPQDIAWRLRRSLPLSTNRYASWSISQDENSNKKRAESKTPAGINTAGALWMDGSGLGYRTKKPRANKTPRMSLHKSNFWAVVTHCIHDADRH